MTQIISGRDISAEIRGELKDRVSILKSEYGVTPGCKGCESVGTKQQRRHTPECKQRFAKILKDAPLEVVADKETEEPWKEALEAEEEDLFGDRGPSACADPEDKDLDVSSDSVPPSPLHSPSSTVYSRGEDVDLVDDPLLHDSPVEPTCKPSGEGVPSTFWGSGADKRGQLR